MLPGWGPGYIPGLLLLALVLVLHDATGKIHNIPFVHWDVDGSELGPVLEAESRDDSTEVDFTVSTQSPVPFGSNWHRSAVRILVTVGDDVSVIITEVDSDTSIEVVCVQDVPFVIEWSSVADGPFSTQSASG